VTLAPLARQGPRGVVRMGAAQPRFPDAGRASSGFASFARISETGRKQQLREKRTTENYGFPSVVSAPQQATIRFSETAGAAASPLLFFEETVQTSSMNNNGLPHRARRARTRNVPMTAPLTS